ncbi:hypothetical protein TCAL_13128 [Tigriopus californicus]|uniref:Nucleoporin Nup54 alpha-helical domain-containing protein n=1 Tax=Tigriopus californicus TaxID=6832 RepID=A0A553NBP3_TIGCA|nr:nuclear pore complex protein Nup54-like [Tigriopus californicus]TRY62779.1 hypothetical protein TCAL_13128 [Tigriopus californicus]|eukprot:TCALIF_13128-PA protein Name:"Similar to Nup54 Nuclear pore complex protein Nup54 (Rattus norvegicus)" AED:0.01 eAED:0.01 QI:117/1/1/1/1/1/2/80/609
MAFSFGGTPASGATSSAFGFGGAGVTPANSMTTAFGGGFATNTSMAPPAFGTPATAPSFGSLGGTNTGAFGGLSTANRPGALSFGGGTPGSMAGSNFGGFGAPAASGSLFGGSMANTGSISTATSAFGGTSMGMGALGTQTTGAFGGSGGAFGGGSSFMGGGGLGLPKPAQPAQPGGLFGGSNSLSFGSGTNASGPMAPGLGGGMAGTPVSVDQVQQLYNAVLHCTLFGDERDAILARWNMLQASWGVGRAFFSNSAVPLALSAENPLCRFKTIGYSAMPRARNEDGILSALIKKKLSEMEPLSQQVPQHLLGVLGQRPGLKVILEGMRSAGPDSTELTFHVQETNGQTGQTRRIPVDEIHPFLMQPMQVQNLQKLGIESLTPKVSFSKDQIKEYLDHPPQGVDPRLWKQAHLENPNPKSLLPVPMIGFKTLQQRIQRQDHQAKTYQGRLDAIAGDISDLQKRHQDAQAKMKEVKRRQLELGHRILHVIVKQEESRKIGFTIQPEEERLRIQLEALQSEISAPTQFKGRLNELLSQVRLRSQSSNSFQSGSQTPQGAGSMDPFLLQDVKQVLKQQQDAIQALVKLITDDIKDLTVITDQLDKDDNQTGK